MRTKPIAVVLLATLAACAAQSEDAAAPTTSTLHVTASVSGPAATATPAIAPRATAEEAPLTALPRFWTATVGRTDSQTTMAVVGQTLIIGSHGGSFDASDEASDGVYLIDGATGVPIRVIATPGHGDRDVNGIAVDGDRVFFSTGNRQLVAARLDGHILWTRPLGGEAVAAPTLVDVDGDGRLDVIAGDDSGRLHAVDGPTGREIWSRTLGDEGKAHPQIRAGIAVGELGGDGRRWLVAATSDGVVRALTVADGATVWSARGDGPVSAAPVLVDVDGDGRLEVVVAWEDGGVRVLDGRAGRELWARQVDRTENLRVRFLGSAIPFAAGRPPTLAVAAGREPDDGGLLLLREQGSALRSGDAGVVATPIVASLRAHGDPLALFGTSKGEVVALDPAGTRTVVGRVGGPIGASIFVTDVDNDGVYEVLAAAGDGTLTCFTTGVRDAPAAGRFRGDSPTNDGVLRDATLRWRLRAPETSFDPTGR